MSKLCVFDLDGTLINSIEDIGDAVNHCLDIMGKPQWEISCYNKMVGNGMNKLCQRALNGGTEEEVKTLIELYKDYYQKNCCIKTKAYDGIDGLLKGLKKGNVEIAILTNKPQSQCDEIVKKLFPEKIFCEIMGQSEKFPIKPDPEGLYYIMKKMGVKSEDVWFIGDSDVDIILSKNAGVKGIGALWGLRGEAELKRAGAVYLAEKPMDILNIV